MLRLRLRLMLFIGMLLVASGCLQTFQEFHLKSDLSGTIAFKVVYDMEEILETVAAIQGGEGDAEMTKMLKESLRGEAEQKLQMPSKQRIKAKLPKGIKLLSLKAGGKGEKKLIYIKFAFDHIDRLQDFKNVKLFQNIPNEVAGIPIPVKDPLQQIKDIVVARQGNKLVISQKLSSIEVLRNKEALEAIPGSERMVKKIADTMGFFFKVGVPYQKYRVIEHTADKYDKKNHVLYWLYPSAKVKKILASEEVPSLIHVVLQEK